MSKSSQGQVFTKGYFIEFDKRKTKEKPQALKNSSSALEHRRQDRERMMGWLLCYPALLEYLISIINQENNT